MKRYFVGIDIGSSAIHSAILDESGGIAYVSPSCRILELPLRGLQRYGRTCQRMLQRAGSYLRPSRA